MGINALRLHNGYKRLGACGTQLGGTIVHTRNPLAYKAARMNNLGDYTDGGYVYSDDGEYIGTEEEVFGTEDTSSDTSSDSSYDEAAQLQADYDAWQNEFAQEGADEGWDWGAIYSEAKDLVKMGLPVASALIQAQAHQGVPASAQKAPNVTGGVTSTGGKKPPAGGRSSSSGNSAMVIGGVAAALALAFFLKK